VIGDYYIQSMIFCGIPYRTALGSHEVLIGPVKYNLLKSELLIL